MAPLRPAALLCLLAAAARAAFAPTGPGGGGALFVPAVSPRDGNLMFVACDMGGVYRSADGGTSWSLLDKRQLRDAHRCPVLFHPQYAAWIYADGGGILKMSRDAGRTWTALCAQQPWGGEPLTALALDEGEPRLMFAGCSFGAYRSVDGGKTWGPCAGVTGRVAGFFVDPTTPVAHRIVVAGTSTGIFRSDDSGSRWRDSSAGLPSRAVRAFCGSGNARAGRVAMYALTPGQAVNGGYAGGCYRSADHGTTWQSAMGAGIDTAIAKADAWGADGIAQYPFLAVPHEMPDTAFVATPGTGYWPPHHGTVYRTDDGGATWRPLVLGDPRSHEAVGLEANITARGWLPVEAVWGLWNGSHGGLAVSAADPGHLVFTNDGELYQSHDGGATWAQAYTRPADPAAIPAPGQAWATTGLDVTSVWRAVFDPHAPGHVLLCETDIGLVRSEDGGASWRWSAAGSPWRNTCYDAVFDPEVPGLAWGGWSDQHDLPHWSQIEGPRGGGGVLVSRDAGVTWSLSGSGLPDAAVTALVLDRHSPKGHRSLWAASFGSGVFHSTDGGTSWKPCAAQPGYPGNRHAYGLALHPDGTLFCTVTGRREADRFPVAGGLFRTHDGGRSWEDLTQALALRWPGDVAADPRDSRVLWLGASAVPGLGQGGIYRTGDGGKTWKKVLDEAILPMELESYAHALFVTLDPAAPDTCYAGIMTHGLWVTRDAGRTWHEVPGLPHRACQRVAFDPAHPGELWVTTFGAGCWRGTPP